MDRYPEKKCEYDRLIYQIASLEFQSKNKDDVSNKYFNSDSKIYFDRIRQQLINVLLRYQIEPKISSDFIELRELIRALFEQKHTIYSNQQTTLSCLKELRVPHLQPAFASSTELDSLCIALDCALGLEHRQTDVPKSDTKL